MGIDAPANVGKLYFHIHFVLEVWLDNVHRVLNQSIRCSKSNKHHQQKKNNKHNMAKYRSDKPKLAGSNKRIYRDNINSKKNQGQQKFESRAMTTKRQQQQHPKCQQHQKVKKHNTNNIRIKNSKDTINNSNNKNRQHHHQHP